MLNHRKKNVIKTVSFSFRGGKKRLQAFREFIKMRIFRRIVYSSEKYEISVLLADGF